MFRVLEIESITNQKRTLLLRSEEYRRFIAGEISAIRQSTQWVQTTGNVIRNNYSYLLLLLPFLSIFRRKKKLGKTVGRLASATKWALKIKNGWNLIQSYRARRVPSA
jgi:hypothetical protein